MHGWWIALGLAVAVLALPCPRLLRRRAQRARLNLIRAQVERSLSALDPSMFSGTSVSALNPKQPDGTVSSNPPTEDNSPPGVSAVRPRRRVAPSDPADLSAALFPGWRLR